MSQSYLSLFAALRRGIPDLAPCAAIVLERGLEISRGEDFYPGAGEIADWLGDDDRRHAQRIRSSLIKRGLLIDVERRKRENGADSSLLCRFAESVLAIYRSWRDARDAATNQNVTGGGGKTPPLESEAKNQDSDLQNNRGVLGADAPSETDRRRSVYDAEAYSAQIKANRHFRWLQNLTAWASEFYSGNWQHIEAIGQHIDAAARAGCRQATPAESRKIVDTLDKAYRRAVEAGWKRPDYRRRENKS